MTQPSIVGRVSLPASQNIFFYLGGSTVEGKHYFSNDLRMNLQGGKKRNKFYNPVEKMVETFYNPPNRIPDPALA